MPLKLSLKPHEKFVLNGAALAVEKFLRLAHQLAIARFIDAARARRGATLDLEQQARPCAAFEHAVGAGALQERAVRVRI